ncbi:hypothetical protein EYF80_041123 [Liparis tanakae]|uniref:Uncharacterized protein n=1 Tax=Liparis tanakae TaxID=230148 RepID=A0A4Z2G520_9TELE|nr:hypothetical protein EYF80_041123 [Liparis tanakae]
MVGSWFGEADKHRIHNQPPGAPEGCKVLSVALNVTLTRGRAVATRGAAARSWSLRRKWQAPDATAV